MCSSVAASPLLLRISCLRESIFCQHSLVFTFLHQKTLSLELHVNVTYLSNMNRRLRSAVRYPQQYIFVLLLSWNLMPGQQTISTKENLPDIAPPKRGRRASIHVPSTPTFQVPEPVAPFTQVPPANDTSSQEVGQTQVNYGPPKKKTLQSPTAD